MPEETAELPVSPPEGQSKLSLFDKLNPPTGGLKFKILGVVLAVLVFVGLVFGVRKREKRETQPGPGQKESCIKTDTGESMSLSEAREIALQSECVDEESLKDDSFCNESTGTWWLDLDIQKEGCAPACVINVSTKKAEINWRCTGVVSPD